MGVTNYNTTNMDLVIGSAQGELQIKIIWSHNVTDVMKLLSQFLHTWHGDDINMQEHLGTFGDGEGHQQIKGEGHGFCLVKGEHPLTI